MEKDTSEDTPDVSLRTFAPYIAAIVTVVALGLLVFLVYPELTKRQNMLATTNGVVAIFFVIQSETGEEHTEIEVLSHNLAEAGVGAYIMGFQELRSRFRAGSRLVRVEIVEAEKNEKVTASFKLHERTIVWPKIVWPEQLRN